MAAQATALAKAMVNVQVIRDRRERVRGTTRVRLLHRRLMRFKDKPNELRRTPPNRYF